MGLFDYVKADTDIVKGEFQTKSANSQMDHYKILNDGLYIRANDKWYKHPWFTGEFVFYTYHKETREWEEYLAIFKEGNLTKPIERVR